METEEILKQSKETTANLYANVFEDLEMDDFLGKCNLLV